MMPKINHASDHNKRRQSRINRLEAEVDMLHDALQEVRRDYERMGVSGGALAVVLHAINATEETVKEYQLKIYHETHQD